MLGRGLLFPEPGAACPAATAAIDHPKSKAEGDISGGTTQGGEACRERCSVLWVCYQKNEPECVSNLSSVEFAALQSSPTINKVFKTHRL